MKKQVQFKIFDNPPKEECIAVGHGLEVFKYYESHDLDCEWGKFAVRDTDTAYEEYGFNTAEEAVAFAKELLEV